MQSSEQQTITTDLSADNAGRHNDGTAQSANNDYCEHRPTETYRQQSETNPKCHAEPSGRQTAILPLPSRISTVDVCVTTRQLATLLQAGLPLVPALGALVEQLGRHPLAGVTAQLRESVNNGASLAEALQNYRRIFGELYINLVRAGEASGTLEQVLVRLADLLEKRTRLNNKIKAALTYPLIMAAVAVGVVIFLMAFVVPSIAEVFGDMNRTLPGPTVLLIAMAEFVRQYILVLVVGMAGIVVGLVAYVNGDHGRSHWDRLKLKLPAMGNLLLKTEMSRLSRILATLLSSGVPVLNALNIAKAVLQNRHLATALDEVREKVGHGSGIATAMKQNGLFPPILVHTVAVGEMSGNLEEGLLRIADAYDDEIHTQARSMTAMLEPAILLIMGFVVGFIVLAMLLPIFEINQMM